MKRRRCTVEGCDDRRLFTPMHFGRDVRIRHRLANAANGADHAGTARRLAMGSSTEEEDGGGGDGTSEEEDAGVGGAEDDNGEDEDVGHDLDGGGVGDGGGGGSDTWELGSVFDEASSSEYDSDASTTTDDISGTCLSGEPDDGRTVQMRVADDLHIAAGVDRATPVLSDGDLGDTLCEEVLDYIDGFGDEEVCRSVFEDKAPSDTFAFITPSLRDVFSNTCTMSGARIAAAHQMCLSVERATDAMTTPLKDAFPTPASLDTAVRNEKKCMLRKLGWMEAVFKTKVGTHQILLRKGLLAVQDCLSGASTVRWERGSDECTCAAGVCYTPNASHVGSDADSQDGADAATSRVKDADVHPRTATPTTACAMCTPSVSEGGDVPDSPVLQDGGVLRDIFDGRAYWAQRADVNHVFGLRALMLALALYSDGTVATSSGGTFSHIPASVHCAGWLWPVVALPYHL